MDEKRVRPGVAGGAWRPKVDVLENRADRELGVGNGRKEEQAGGGQLAMWPTYQAPPAADTLFVVIVVADLVFCEKQE